MQLFSKLLLVFLLPSLATTHPGIGTVKDSNAYIRYTGLQQMVFAEIMGLGVGSKCPAFDPTHITGADAGTHTCPMCKYGARTEGLLVWLNHDVQQAEKLLKFLENDYLTPQHPTRKVFVMYMNPKGKNDVQLKQELKAAAQKMKLHNLALTFVPSPTDAETCGVYCLNPDNKNTIFAYRKRVVVSRIENFEASDENLKKLVAF